MNGLEALSDLRFNISYSQDMDYKENNDLCDIIKKELKALEIIKRVKDDLNFILCWDNYTQFITAYKKLDDSIKCQLVSAKEFELLKKVLNNGEKQN